MAPALQDTSIAAALFALLLLSLEVGYRIGRRAAADTQSFALIGAVQAAILGLLGLLLAFSFAAAGTRFIDRQDLIVQEANAIGTVSLRADLLDQPHRAALLQSLKRYTDFRVEVSLRARAGPLPTDPDRAQSLQAELWHAATDAALARPDLALLLLPPVNDILDFHTTRLAAIKKRIPPLVLGLLIACSMLAMGVFGLGAGAVRRRHLAVNATLALMLGASLWITIDLDNPRAGLIRLSDEPLTSLVINPPAPAPPADAVTSPPR